MSVAIASLEFDQIVVHITGASRRLPPDLVAGAAEDGIWLRSTVLQEDRVLLASILLEEAGHLKMIELGTIGGLDSFTGALVNEFFGTWYAFYELMQVQPSIVERFDDGPIPPGPHTPRAGYVLGAFSGAAAAGVPAAQRRLDAWLDHNAGDPAIQAAVRRIQAIAASAGSPLDMAMRLATKFPPSGDRSADSEKDACGRSDKPLGRLEHRRGQ